MELKEIEKIMKLLQEGNLEIENILINDKQIQKVNSNIVQLIKEFNM